MQVMCACTQTLSAYLFVTMHTQAHLWNTQIGLRAQLNKASRSIRLLHQLRPTGSSTGRENSRGNKLHPCGTPHLITTQRSHKTTARQPHLLTTLNWETSAFHYCQRLLPKLTQMRRICETSCPFKLWMKKHSHTEWLPKWSLKWRSRPSTQNTGQCVVASNVTVKMWMDYWQKHPCR